MIEVVVAGQYNSLFTMKLSEDRMTMQASSLSFLTLPKDIRIIIYSYAHLLRPCSIDLACERQRAKKACEQGKASPTCLHRIELKPFPCDERQTNEGLCCCPPLPYQLLRVSKAIYDDVEPLLYTLNHFIVTASETASPDHLQVLHTLSSRALACLQSLHIELSARTRPQDPDDLANPLTPHNVQTRDAPRDVFADWSASCWNSEPTDLRCSPHRLQRDSSELPTILSQGNVTFEHLSSRVVALQLDFSMSCITDDVVVAKAVIGLLKKLPVLKSCAIHFGDQENAELKGMAKLAVSQLCKTDSLRRIQGSFDELPKELRIKILSYTDLVYRWKPYRDDDGLSVLNGQVDYSSQNCCSQCSDSLAVCCCSQRAVAFSNKCSCYRVPLALFTVNHRLYNDAMEVFFSGTRFRFYDDFDSSRQWIIGLPPQARSWIRTFDVVFQLETVRCISAPGNMLFKSWNRLVETIRDALAVSKLWISLDAGDAHEDYLYLQDRYIDEEGGDFDWLRTAYAEIIGPLKQHLKGLRKLHVFLSWFPEYEREAEQEVVGPKYDSAAEGKSPFGLRSVRWPHRWPSLSPTDE